MSSFLAIRDAVLFSHDNGFIDDEEFILLYEECTSTNLQFPYDDYPRFDLESKDAAECKSNFRVEKNDLPSSPKPLEFLHNSRAIKELSAMEWKACVSYWKDVPIPAAILIWFLSLDDQSPNCAWSAMKWLTRCLKITVIVSQSATTQFWMLQPYKRMLTL